MFESVFTRSEAVFSRCTFGSNCSLESVSLSAFAHLDAAVFFFAKLLQLCEGARDREWTAFSSAAANYRLNWDLNWFGRSRTLAFLFFKPFLCGFWGRPALQADWQLRHSLSISQWLIWLDSKGCSVALSYISTLTCECSFVFMV